MTKNMRALLALIVITKYYDAQGFYDKMSCANCSGVNEECNITTSGWSCDFDFDAKKLIDDGDSSEIPESLRKCMLPGMEFKKKQALHSYCCFWSPKLGCQKLKRSDDEEDLCYMCTRETWASVMGDTMCPCGDWYLQNVSREIRLKPWNYFLIMQGMLIIIINL